MEPIGRDVGARGRAVEGLALEVNGLAGRVVATWVVVKGPEVREREREKSRQREFIGGCKGFVGELQNQKPPKKDQENEGHMHMKERCLSVVEFKS